MCGSTRHQAPPADPTGTFSVESTTIVPDRVLFTIGHSTLTLEAFSAALEAHAIRQLADVRLIPRSRRHPHFGGAALAQSLAVRGIRYEHFRDLGGRRQPRPDSANTAWQHPAFRGYADYMATGAFEAGLGRLLSLSAAAPTAIMCAEARWWQCHRRLIADALVARGVQVRHIMGPGAAARHVLMPFARITNGRVTYPGLI